MITCTIERIKWNKKTVHQVSSFTPLLQITMSELLLENHTSIGAYYVLRTSHKPLTDIYHPGIRINLIFMIIITCHLWKEGWTQYLSTYILFFTSSLTIGTMLVHSITWCHHSISTRPSSWSCAFDKFFEKYNDFYYDDNGDDDSDEKMMMIMMMTIMMMMMTMTTTMMMMMMAVPRMRFLSIINHEVAYKTTFTRGTIKIS